LRKVGINGFEVKGYGSPNFTTMETGAILYEMGKYDTALTLFLFVQCSLGIHSIDHCCNEEQKQRFLPDLISLKNFTCFALTEPNYGSDATSMETTAKKVEGGYILNG
jgi:acyl-CoA oxidase